MLWFARNKLVHDGVRQSVHAMAGIVLGRAKEFGHLHHDTTMVISEPLHVWCPSAHGFVKLNFDASFRGPASSAVASIVARNDRAEIMGACCYTYRHVANL